MHASLDLGEWTSLTGKSFYVWKRIVQPVASTGSSENARCKNLRHNAAICKLPVSRIA